MPPSPRMALSGRPSDTALPSGQSHNPLSASRVPTEGSDSGYGSNETSPDDQQLQKGSSCTEGIALPSSRTFFKRKLTRLKPFDKEIPQFVKNRFYDLYELFSVPLYQHLADAGTITSASMKLAVLGESENSAKPWIVISCDARAVKRTRQFFDQPHIKVEYQPHSHDPNLPSFGIVVCNRPPRPIALATPMNLGNEKAVSSDSISRMVYSTRISAETICGSVVRIGEKDLGRFATIGGIVKIEDRDASYMLYSVTAGHVAITKQLEEQDFDISDTSMSSWVDGGTDDEEFFIDEEEPWSELAGNGAQTGDVLGSGIVGTSRTSLPVSEDAWWRIGRISTISQNQAWAGNNLDWALIAFHDPFLYRPNSVLFPNTETPKLLAKTVSEEEQDARLKASDCAVFLIGGMSGIKRARLSSTWAYLLLSPAKGFARHLTLTFLDGSTARPGDCGSWVVSEAHHEVLGFLVASGPMNEAYVAPIHASFQDIKRQLGAASVSLPSEIDVERWLRHCTPWLSKFASGVPCLQDFSHLLVDGPQSKPKLPPSQTGLDTESLKTIVEDAVARQITKSDPQKSLIASLNEYSLEGYELTNSPRLDGGEPTWTTVLRKPMFMSRKALMALVKEQCATGICGDDLLRESDIQGEKKAQVLRLLDEIAKRDGGDTPPVRLGYLRLVNDAVIQVIVLTNASQPDSDENDPSKGTKLIHLKTKDEKNGSPPPTVPGSATLDAQHSGYKNDHYRNPLDNLQAAASKVQNEMSVPPNVKRDALQLPLYIATYDEPSVPLRPVIMEVRNNSIGQDGLKKRLEGSKTAGGILPNDTTPISRDMNKIPPSEQKLLQQQSAGPSIQRAGAHLPSPYATSPEKARPDHPKGWLDDDAQSSDDTDSSCDTVISDIASTRTFETYETPDTAFSSHSRSSASSRPMSIGSKPESFKPRSSMPTSSRFQSLDPRLLLPTGLISGDSKNTNPRFHSLDSNVLSKSARYRPTTAAPKTSCTRKNMHYDPEIGDTRQPRLMRAPSPPRPPALEYGQLGGTVPAFESPFKPYLGRSPTLPMVGETWPIQRRTAQQRAMEERRPRREERRLRREAKRYVEDDEEEEEDDEEGFLHPGEYPYIRRKLRRPRGRSEVSSQDPNPPWPPSAHADLLEQRKESAGLVEKVRSRLTT